MNIKHKALLQIGLILVLLGSLTVVAFAAPPAQEEDPKVGVSQDPRPPDDSGSGNGGDNGDSSSGSSDDAASSSPTCASLQGQMINWGAGPMGGIAAELKTGSWQLSASSASDGNYGFGGLGIGIATLHINLPPELNNALTPHIQDAAVYLNCDYPFVANLALSSGATVEPPASLEMMVPDNLSPGTSTVIRLNIKNTLPNDISNVIVTNLMPNGFAAIDVTTVSSGESNSSIIDGGDEGQLVLVHFDSIPSNMEENILVAVALDADLAPGSQIKNTATLFYRESVADQVSLDLTVGAGGLPVPVAEADIVTQSLVAEVTVATPTIEATEVTTQVNNNDVPMAAVEEADEEAADDGTGFMPPPDLPTTGDNFYPPPGMLPETGQNSFKFSTPLSSNSGVSPFIPLGGLILGGVILIFQLARGKGRG